MKLEMDSFQSPIGQVTLIARDSELVFVDFEGNDQRMRRLLEARFGVYQLEKASLQILDPNSRRIFRAIVMP